MSPSPRVWSLAVAPLVVLLAGFHGLAVTSIVARALASAPPPPLDRPPPPIAPRYHRTTSAPLFASEDRPERAVSAVGFERPYDAPPCAGVRVATLASSVDVGASFVSLEGGAGGTIAPRRQGDRYGDRTVWFVGTDRAWLADADGLCQATLREAPLPATSLSAHAPAAPANGLAARIERRGPDDYVVDRATLDALLEQAPILARGVRASFEQENGRTVGVRLTGVRPGDPLAALGLDSGDRIEKIGGVELSGPDKALEAYARSRLDAHISIVVRRGATARTIDLQVR